MSTMIEAVVVEDSCSKMAFSGSFVVPSSGGNNVSGAILVIALVSASESISDDGIRVDDTDCVDAACLVVFAAPTPSDTVELESSNAVLSVAD